jgi:CTP synthase
MRLGAYKCVIQEGSLAHSVYGDTEISERHRHRYELNNQYLQEIENAGLIASGRNKETGLVEIMELPNHPYFIGVQFHPELKSTPEKPHPLFTGLIKSAIIYKNGKA